MRVYEACVPESAEGMRADRYLAQAFPLLPAHVVRDALNARDVKMDGARLGKDALVQPGAKILLYTSFALTIPIVFEDENILLINKPAGISAQEDGRGGLTVASLLEKQQKGAISPGCAIGWITPPAGSCCFAKTMKANGRFWLPLRSGG